MAKKGRYTPLPSGKGETRQTHMAFIAQNLDVAAATAWQGYRAMGRCALVVVTEWGDVRQPWTAGITPVSVMARKKALKMLEGINPPARSDLARLLRQYDPEREMVFCFLRTDYGVSSYRVGSPRLTPPEAYEVMKGQLADSVLTDEEVEAGYGALWPDREQGLGHYSALATKLGFEVIEQRQEGHTFFLELLRPQS